jgi:hypothetical protein
MGIVKIGNKKIYVAFKIFYDVAYEQKEMAKSYNLRWDIDKKCWYGTNIDYLVDMFDIKFIEGCDDIRSKEIIERHNNNRKLCHCVSCRQYLERKMVHRTGTSTVTHSNGYIELRKHYRCKKCIKTEAERKAKHEHLYKTDKAYREDCDGRNRSVNEYGHE